MHATNGRSERNSQQNGTQRTRKSVEPNTQNAGGGLFASEAPLHFAEV